MNNEHFWEFNEQVDNVNTPLDIANEIASQLEIVTHQMLMGDISIYFDSNSNKSEIRLYVIAPELNNYHYLLISIQEKSIVQSYPAKIILFLDDDKIVVEEANNETEFKNSLKNFIQNEFTRNLISKLIGNVKKKRIIEKL